MIKKIAKPFIRQRNRGEHQPVAIGAEQRVHTASRTAAGIAMANTARQDEQLEELHESIRELARLALPYVGTERDVTGQVEIIRPLPQDRSWSEKLRRVDAGQGFTRSEYMSGVHTQGSETRRFHVLQGPGFDDVRGVALPYAVARMQPLTKRPRVRPNSRPEDLAIALDDSGRSWSGIMAPHDTPAGKKSNQLPLFGVLEDPKSQLSPYPYNMLANHQTVVPTDPEAIGNRILWLEGINEEVIKLQQQVADPGHPSHDHVPRPTV
jgi:hypothetical protein